MWTIIKIDRKKINFLKRDFNAKLKEDFKLYIPLIKVEKYYKHKLVKKEINLLGDYIFCEIKNFDKNVLNKLKFSRGLKYFLIGFLQFQEEIKKFILKCKSYENNEGYISYNFVNLEINKKYKFSSGPFVDKIFELLKIKENKLDIVLGGFNTTIDKTKFLFNPA